MLVLMRATVEAEATYAPAKGYVIEGTEGEGPFRDVVDAYTVVCRDQRTEITPACEDYQAEHGF